MEITSKKVTFESHGEKINGELFLPINKAENLQAFTIVGPTLYARILASNGFAALIFEPRNKDLPHAFAEDLKAACKFLTKESVINPEKIYGLSLGIDASVMMKACAEDIHMRALFAIAPHLRDNISDREWLGKEEVDRRLSNGDHEFMTYESLSSSTRIKKPVMFIHSDKCFQPETIRRHFTAIPSKIKRLTWENGTEQTQFFEDQKVISQAVRKMMSFIDRLNEDKNLKKFNQLEKNDYSARIQ